MGEGQEELAMRVVESAASQGYWVCLKNVHLVKKWLLSLDELINSQKPHENFRLWLTTERTSPFPESLARNCLKVTNIIDLFINITIRPKNYIN